MKQLPEALQPFAKYRQFLIYKLVWNGEKFDKIPLNIHTLTEANPHDPQNQVSANEACEVATRLGDGFGVAFVLTDNDPYWFLDIDKCLINGDWSPLAKELINDLSGCAIEVSQSGSGLHLFGAGRLNPHRCRIKDLNLELYHTGRFIALTGNHAMGNMDLDYTHHINNVIEKYFKQDQALIDAEWTTAPREDWDGPEDDDQLIEKALRSGGAIAAFGNKATFADLWNRNVEVLSANYPDDDDKEFGYSEADAALAQHLAFWTGCNCERMKRLMWRSGLVRDKWEHHKSYLDLTIKVAISRQKDVYNNPKKPLKVDDNIDPFLERIESEGVDPKKARVLMHEIAESSFNKVDRELLAVKLFDTMHSAGIPMKKKTIVDTCMGQQMTPVVNRPDSLIFPDLKANGHPKNTKENVKSLLNYLGITCRYNLMSKEVEINIPNASYTVDNALNCALNDVISQAARYDMTKSAIEDNILSISDENRYNPAKLWIDNNEWDGVDRIEPLVKSLDPKNYQLAYWFIRRWLISAVAAIFNPQGVSAQGMVVLQGEQYLGKSRWFWSLLPYKDWGKESHILNPHDKDNVKQAVSRWITELGELDGTFKKSDIEALKGFITKGEDELRLPYARLTSKYPRRTVFFGTVNPEQYLHDDTGNRRFWTVSCGSGLNADHGIDIGQLWGQIKVHYDSGEQWWLTPEENNALNEYNRDFEAKTPIEELIAVHYDKNAERKRPMTATEVLKEIGYDKPTKVQVREAGAALRSVLGAYPRKSDGRNVYDMPLMLSKHFIDY